VGWRYHHPFQITSKRGMAYPLVDVCEKTSTIAPSKSRTLLDFGFTRACNGASPVSYRPLLQTASTFLFHNDSPLPVSPQRQQHISSKSPPAITLVSSPSLSGSRREENLFLPVMLGHLQQDDLQRQFIRSILAGQQINYG
jgi:hypothetical protein